MQEGISFWKTPSLAFLKEDTMEKCLIVMVKQNYFRRKHGSSDIPWGNSHFDKEVVPILLQPRFYLQYSLFTERYWLAGSSVSGLTQPMCVFDWATTTSPWSMKRFIWLSFFFPSLNWNWTWAKTHRCCSSSVTDRNKAMLFLAFTIWSQVSGS